MTSEEGVNGTRVETDEMWRIRDVDDAKLDLHESSCFAKMWVIAHREQKVRLRACLDWFYSACVSYSLLS